MPNLSLTRPQDMAEAFFESSPIWYWRVLLLLVGWLHLFYHLSHAGCALILKVLRVIFVATALLPADSSVPVTLRTTMRHFKLDDKFKRHPVCVSCHMVFPSEFGVVFCIPLV